MKLPTHEVESNSALRVEARDLLTDTTTKPRPHAREMASLVLRGLTNLHLIDAWADLGHAVPDMSLALDELDATLPHIDSLTSTLASNKPDKNTLYVFPARDAEALHDYFVTAHDAHQSTLLPASTALMKSLDAGAKSPKTREFLENHGITQELIQNPESKVVVVDTGFEGTIGHRLGKLVGNLYEGGCSLQDEGRVAIKLVHANYDGHGEYIDGDIAAFDIKDTLPRSHSWIGSEKLKTEEGYETPTAALAISLQLHPRYHGTYTGLKRQPDGEITAVSLNEKIRDNIDTYWVEGEQGRNNDSIVNPLAALVVQRHIVAAALRRKTRTPLRARATSVAKRFALS